MRLCVHAQHQNYRHRLVADANLALELATVRSAHADDEMGCPERGGAGNLVMPDVTHPGLRPLTALLGNLVYSTSDEACGMW